MSLNIIFKAISCLKLSYSTSSSVSSGCDVGEFSKADERRLRDYIQQLKNDRASVRMTVMELESVHIDPTTRDPPTIIDAQKLDLENAVLMQELMAMKVRWLLNVKRRQIYWIVFSCVSFFLCFSKRRNVYKICFVILFSVLH